MKLAFLGLGVMGYPMAGHWQKAGHDVCVFNRTKKKAESWASEFGGRHAASPKDAVADAEIVAMCLGDDPDVEMVVLGPMGCLKASPQEAFLLTTPRAQPSLPSAFMKPARPRI